MQTSVLQTLALTTHGNAVMAGNPAKNFFPNHGVFQFDEFVQFVDLEDSGNATTLYAADPVVWFERLKSEDCLGLRAHWIASKPAPGTPRDWETVSFVGGGGRWVIEAVFEGGSDIWEGRWDLGDRNHPSKKIWRVSYGRVAKGWTTAPASTRAFPEVAGVLRSTLKAAYSYAKQNGYDGFAGSFDRALFLLQTGDVPAPFAIAPEGQLPLEARRVLAAVQTAWVFGGMGSWNDLGGGPEYEDISRRLFETLTVALVETVNLSYQCVFF